MKNKQYIAQLKTANARFMQKLAMEHDKYLKEIQRDKKVIEWYAKNIQLIQQNLMMLQDRKFRIERRIEIKLSKVSFRDYKLYETSLNAIWQPILEKINKRIQSLENTLYKINVSKNKFNKNRLDAEEIKDHVSIVDVCNKYGIELFRNGGKCPIHKDDNPSFHIYPETNSWFCFGCQSGGSVIDLVMAIEKCDFKLALKYLFMLL